MLVNRHYKVARKQLDLLKKSLFYRQWAKDMEMLLGNEPRINQHPIYGKIRKLRYKDDFLFSYDEMDNLVSVTDYMGRGTHYTYDVEGNLTSITDAAGRTEKLVMVIVV